MRAQKVQLKHVEYSFSLTTRAESNMHTDRDDGSTSLEQRRPIFLRFGTHSICTFCAKIFRLTFSVRAQ